MTNKITPCPTCGKEQKWDPKNTYRPFCSERCKLIDLGEWAGEKRRIAGESVNEDTGSSDDNETY